MAEPKIRDRLIGGWRLTGYEETADGKPEHPLGDDPLGAILYTPDGYMSAQLARPGPYEDDDKPDAYYVAYSGPYDVDQANQTVTHHVQVWVIPSWKGTTQIRQVRFPDPDTLVLSAEGSPREGETTTITWSRRPPR
ncbi:lipocalin-like domain-containing protein [Actinopolymorpha pittospori]|uniref:Lipocalin-like domain-containing protein n=1 Tax=Actinopolymorpha pittospori TaxID=648752 RepID=A0A927N0B2_9ACTN|nr:lipocalin-like domain-containing protein [Actinopolymorpha pittospori]MBE1610265.1 hypothetical protein [Actinopolymorpha pittospori]